MPSTTVTVPHKLPKAEAMDRIKGIVASVQESYGKQVTDIQQEWTDDGGTFSFKAMGFAISGKLEMTDSEMKVEAEFPWAAKPFQSTIETTIRDKAAKLLS